jgi:hypothetical protein
MQDETGCTEMFCCGSVVPLAVLGCRWDENAHSGDRGRNFKRTGGGNIQRGF